MDLENQGTIKQLVDEHGAAGMVVVLGAGELEAIKIAAETVTSGDPAYAGPLAGVSLGLPVFHILEAALKDEVPSALYEEKLGMYAMLYDSAELSTTLEGFRAGGG